MQKFFPAALMVALTLTACQSSVNREYVDLGITDANGKTIYWATTNVGAETPEAYGDYFAWGETSPKETYTASNLKYSSETTDGIQFSKYVTSSIYGPVDNKATLEAEDDAATALWGSDWRTPTNEELTKLVNECYWQWVESYNGKSVGGFVVYKAKSAADKGEKVYIGSTASDSYTLSDPHIFLPAAGNRYGDELSTPGSCGLFWSASVFESCSNTANCLNFNSDDVDWSREDRVVGMSIRPVCTSPK